MPEELPMGTSALELEIESDHVPFEAASKEKPKAKKPAPEPEEKEIVEEEEIEADADDQEESDESGEEDADQDDDGETEEEEIEADEDEQEEEEEKTPAKKKEPQKPAPYKCARMNHWRAEDGALREDEVEKELDKMFNTIQQQQRILSLVAEDKVTRAAYLRAAKAKGWTLNEQEEAEIKEPEKPAVQKPVFDRKKYEELITKGNDAAAQLMLADHQAAQEAYLEALADHKVQSLRKEQDDREKQNQLKTQRAMRAQNDAQFTLEAKALEKAYPALVKQDGFTPDGLEKWTITDDVVQAVFQNIYRAGGLTMAQAMQKALVKLGRVKLKKKEDGKEKTPPAKHKPPLNGGAASKPVGDQRRKQGQRQPGNGESLLEISVE